MKVLIINSSPNGNGHNARAAAALAERFSEMGIDSEIYWLGKGNIKGCLSCYSCLKTDRCIQDDDLVNDLADRIQASDGLVVCAPFSSGDLTVPCAMRLTGYSIRERLQASSSRESRPLQSPYATPWERKLP